MRSLGSSGIWELFLPGVGAGAHYKYEIRTQTTELLLKADPLALESRAAAGTASVVPPHHAWSDDASGCASAAGATPSAGPISIYEVHLGSWRLNPLDGNRPLGYLELADELAAYVATSASPTSSCCR